MGIKMNFIHIFVSQAMTEATTGIFTGRAPNLPK